MPPWGKNAATVDRSSHHVLLVLSKHFCLFFETKAALLLFYLHVRLIPSSFLRRVDSFIYFGGFFVRQFFRSRLTISVTIATLGKFIFRKMLKLNHIRNKRLESMCFRICNCARQCRPLYAKKLYPSPVGQLCLLRRACTFLHQRNIP